MKMRLALIGLCLIGLCAYGDGPANRAAPGSFGEFVNLVRVVLTRYAASQAPAAAVPAVRRSQTAPASTSGSPAGTERVLQADTESVENLVETIRRTAQVNIVLDNAAIRDGAAAGTVRTNITLKVDNMTLRSALNWICRLSGLRWVIKDEAIFISTADRIEGQEQVLRIYDIRDLSSVVEDFPGPQIELVPGEADISISN